MIELAVRDSLAPALVDDEFGNFVGLGWRLNSKGYVIRYSERKIILHRAVMGEIPPGMQVDHINRNKLDCRLQNLRLVTPSQNAQNTPMRNGKIKFNRTGHRGVYFDGERDKFVAQVGRKRIGRFDCLEDAVLAAIAGRKRLMPFSTEV